MNNHIRPRPTQTLPIVLRVDAVPLPHEEGGNDPAHCRPAVRQRDQRCAKPKLDQARPDHQISGQWKPARHLCPELGPQPAQMRDPGNEQGCSEQQAKDVLYQRGALKRVNEVRCALLTSQR